jgi:hypothetical protein
MNVPRMAGLLWAQLDVTKLRLRPNASAGSLLLLLLLVVSCALLVWVVNRVVAARQQQRRYSPRALFRELCRAHHLSFGERWILRKLAAQHKLDQAARMFVEPDKLVAAHPMGEHHRATIAHLRRKLFGLEPAPPG